MTDRERVVKLLKAGKHASQVILTLSQIHFSNSCEKAIVDKDLPLMKESCEKSLALYIKLIQNKKIENLSDIACRIIPSMIIQEVHQRDIVSNLQKNKIIKCEEFEWISKLRFKILQDKNI